MNHHCLEWENMQLSWLRYHINVNSCAYVYSKVTWGVSSTNMLHYGYMFLNLFLTDSGSREELNIFCSVLQFQKGHKEVQKRVIVPLVLGTLFEVLVYNHIFMSWTIWYVISHCGYLIKCAQFLPKHDVAVIFRIGQLLRLIFLKIWGIGKIYTVESR